MKGEGIRFLQRSVVGGHVLVGYIWIKRVCKADRVVRHHKIAGVEPAGSGLRFRGDFRRDVQTVAHLDDSSAADVVDFNWADKRRHYKSLPLVGALDSEPASWRICLILASASAVEVEPIWTMADEEMASTRTD